MAKEMIYDTSSFLRRSKSATVSALKRWGESSTCAPPNFVRIFPLGEGKGDICFYLPEEGICANDAHKFYLHLLTLAKDFASADEWVRQLVQEPTKEAEEPAQSIEFRVVSQFEIGEL